MQDTQFMSADEKRRVLRQWERFLAGGMNWEQFSKGLYDHLIQHCSFIAHYDRAGFYSTYFQSGEDRACFLSQFDQRQAEANGVPPSVEYWGTWWADGDYADINLEMIRVASRYIPALLDRAKDSQRAANVAEAKRLLAKHGLKASVRG